MRTIFWIVLTLLSTTISASAQQPVDNPGFACFENLGTPAYPKAALHGLVDGSVWTTIHVNQQGTPEKIDKEVVSSYSEAVKLLAPQVDKVIHDAKIKPECAGKTVTVVFRYQIFGEATPNPEVTSRTLGSNLMLIESHPAS